MLMLTKRHIKFLNNHFKFGVIIMRISKIRLLSEITSSRGLKEIDLTKKPLGPLVALVGKNGAGKSRILDLIQSYFQYFTNENFLNGFITEWPKEFLKNSVSKINSYTLSLQSLKNTNDQDIKIQQITNTRKNELEKLILELKKVGKAYIKVVDNDALKLINDNLSNKARFSFEQIFNGTYSKIDISNLNFTSRNLNNEQIDEITLNEFQTFNSLSTLQYLNTLSLELITDDFNLYLAHKDDPQLAKKELEKKKSFILFSNFQLYIKKFLGKEMTYKSETKGNTIKSILLYDDKPFDLNLFSPGQKTLFAYAILFFYLDNNSKTKIKDSIIIIDEPEKHLHPEAQILLINAIKKTISKNGQLWIATHSINILSHLEYDEILLIKDGEIIPPSRTTPGNSFSDLMGLEEHISELTSFIVSVSEWAYANFMIQCLKEPEVIFDVNKNDPQFYLFKEFTKINSSMEILDYGAGKGRVGFTLQEDDDLKISTKYSAFEPDKRNYSFLHKVPNLKKLYETKEDLQTEYFDCVLLCGVLHEIHPKEWIDTILEIKRILKNSGYLIIIEDKFLPKGEHAHEFGYLILDNEQIKAFLNATSAFEFKLKDNKYNERIVFTAFSKNELNPDKQSLIKSLKMLNTVSLKNIREFNINVQDLDNGRKFANQTQLFVNSYLALQSFTDQKYTVK